jgi:glycosyltransferase involved in cell wall biosynthesis
MQKILVISTYPPKGTTHEHHLSAVASYTKNTLLSSKTNGDISFVVLGDKLPPFTGDSYIEEGIVIHRVWKRNSPFLFIELIKSIKKHNIEKIMFAFEWAMFGNKIWLSGFLPMFLLILKLMGKKVYLISHGVLLDADEVIGQIGSKKGSLKSRFLTISLKILYWSVVRLSFRVVVFEEGLREELVKLSFQGDKIVTIPHGVEEIQEIPHHKARTILGIHKEEIIVMVFGFLIWYKGTDWIVRKFTDYFEKHPNSRIRLYLVGGETPKYLKNKAYQSFLQEIYEATQKFPNQIIQTGFIQETKIPLYFSAADVVVFPYRVFVSSSGPLSWSFSLVKPVLLSEPLKKYFNTEDMSNALKIAGLSSRDITFSLTDSKDIDKKIRKIVSSRSYRSKLKLFSKNLRDNRSWAKIGKRYAELLLEK